MNKKFIAFLRAINVGGHTVKMDHLRRIFQAFGFEKVETFIASGNVIFSDPVGTQPDELVNRIEVGLEIELGYKVATFVRTPGELEEAARYQAFPQPAIQAAEAYNIGFLAKEPDEPARQRLNSLKTDIDQLEIHGREIYWLCQLKQSQSTLSNAVFEKALEMPSTLRGFNTVSKIVSRLSTGGI